MSYTSRSMPSSGTSRGIVTHLLHIQVHTIQWGIQRKLLTCYTSMSIPSSGASRGSYSPATHPCPYHPVGHPEEVTHLLHIHVHTIQWGIQRKLLTCYTSMSIPSSGASRGSYSPATHPCPYHPVGHPEEVTHLLHIQVHSILWGIQKNSYSPATHPGPFHPAGHLEEQLFTCYTSRSIPSCGTSRGTVTHLLHIQVHTIQWEISRGTVTHLLHIQVHSILWETSRGTVTHLLHIQVHTIQWNIQRNSYSPATHPGPYHPVGHPKEQLLTYCTSRSIPSSGTSRGIVTYLLHIQVHSIQQDI